MGIIPWLFGSVTGIIVLIIGCVTAILIVAICHGTSVTNPRVTVYSVSDSGKRFAVSAGQPYVGPHESRPDSHQMLLGAAHVAEKLSGNDKNRLPNLEDYPELVDSRKR